MAVNKTLLKDASWKDRVRRAVAGAVAGMVEFVTRLSLYPVIVEEAGGRFVETRKILPHQEKFHYRITPSGSRANQVLFVGGAGAGKSTAMWTEVVYILRTYPGVKVVVTTGYDYNFDETVWPQFEKVLPLDDPFWMKTNRKARTFVGTNGCVLRFHAYDDPEKVRGWEADVIVITEATTLGDGNTYKAKQIYTQFLARWRANTPGAPRLILVDTNPGGHDWVWEVFIKGNPHNDEGLVREISPCALHSLELSKDEAHQAKIRACQSRCDKPCAMYPRGMKYREYEKESGTGDVFYTVGCSSFANPTLVKGYVESQLASGDQALINRMVEGLFNPINSLVYEEPWYSEETHVIEWPDFLRAHELDRTDTQEIPREWPLVVGIDTAGALAPWAVECYVETPFSDLVCIHEIYQGGVPWAYIGNKIKDFVIGPVDMAETIRQGKAEAGQEYDPNLEECIYYSRIANKRWRDVRFFIDPHRAPQKEGADQRSVLDKFTEWGIPVQLPPGYNKSTGILQVRQSLLPDLREPCPYKPDRYDPDQYRWAVGRARLYYVRGACPGNLAEKKVWRFDKKQDYLIRGDDQGLSAPVQEKPVDRDDHAQTAEIFALLGHTPPPEARSRSKRHNPDDRARTGGYSKPAYESDWRPR